MAKGRHVRTRQCTSSGATKHLPSITNRVHTAILIAFHDWRCQHPEEGSQQEHHHEGEPRLQRGKHPRRYISFNVTLPHLNYAPMLDGESTPRGISLKSCIARFPLAMTPLATVLLTIDFTGRQKPGPGFSSIDTAGPTLPAGKSQARVSRCSHGSSC
jgi:hypothetical protein